MCCGRDNFDRFVEGQCDQVSKARSWDGRASRARPVLPVAAWSALLFEGIARNGGMGLGRRADSWAVAFCCGWPVERGRRPHHSTLTFFLISPDAARHRDPREPPCRLHPGGRTAGQRAGCSRGEPYAVDATTLGGERGRWRPASFADATPGKLSGVLDGLAAGVGDRDSTRQRGPARMGPPIFPRKERKPRTRLESIVGIPTRRSAKMQRWPNATLATKSRGDAGTWRPGAWLAVTLAGGPRPGAITTTIIETAIARRSKSKNAQGGRQYRHRSWLAGRFIADKGYHSKSEMIDLAAVGLRLTWAEPGTRGRRGIGSQGGLRPSNPGVWPIGGRLRERPAAGADASPGASERKRLLSSISTTTVGCAATHLRWPHPIFIKRLA